jgi:PRTRC genetic system ThiF family protein
MSSIVNLDLNSQTLTINDSNGSNFSAMIQSHYGDLGVRNSGIVDGNYTLDLLEDLPIREVENNNVLLPPMSMKHTPHFTARAGVEYVDIVIAGVGGTGAYVVRDLSRFLYSLQLKDHLVKVKLHLFDDDIVEEKNLIRQNFIPRDLGKFKVDAIGKRYGTAFGVDIVTHGVKLTQTELESIYNPYPRTTQNMMIIIGCVDNNFARREIHNFLQRNPSNYWIDSGNERSSGQVICGYGKMSDWYPEDLRYESCNNTQFVMPTVTALYPEILDESQDNVGDDNTSCAERALVEDQNIFVNMTAAVNVLNFVRQLILKEPLTIGGVEFNIKGVNNVHHLTEDYIQQVRSNITF